MSQFVRAPRSPTRRKPLPEPSQKECDEILGGYRPRTEWGRKILALRKKIKASGEPWLSWEDIDRELADRRGDSEDNGS